MVPNQPCIGPAQEARNYLKRGWLPTPIARRSKKPILSDWPQRRIAEDEVVAHFADDANIGIVLGTASGGLIDIDLDCAEARVLAPRMLPPTDAVFGRRSSPASHRLYRSTSPCGSTARFKGADGGSIVEFRADGAQTVFPGSTHESGEPIEWVTEGEPQHVDAAALLRRTTELAAGCLLLRHYPQPGSRHDYTLALAGGLLRGGWCTDRVKSFVEALVTAAEDEDLEDRLAGVESTASALRDGRLATGWPRLAEIIGERGEATTRLISRWLQCDASGSVDRSVPTAVEDWREPNPLPDELPPVMKCDPELLPDSFRPWLVDIAERVQCPLDFLAATAMTALAGVVGRKVGIRPKQQDDWLVVPNLWGMVIGRPGIMKTPAIQETLNPLKRLEIEAKEEHETKDAAYQAEKLVAEQRKKVKTEEIKKKLKDNLGAEAFQVASELIAEEPNKPSRRRFLVNDSTVEKLGELLNENPWGLTVYRDELIGLFRTLEKDGQEHARAFYLEAWAGNQRFTSDRIGRGTIDIEAACISIIGGIQPGRLMAFLDDAIRGGSGDDGLIQRFQLAVWPDVSRRWVNVDRWPDTGARKTAHDVFTRLDALDPQAIGATPDAMEPDGIPFLHFEPAAQQEFDRWRTTLELRLRSGEEHPAMESHLAKYRSLVPSIALLTHLADGGIGAVSHGALVKAIRWAAYLESHARRIYAVVVDGELAAAQALVKKLKAGKIKNGFTLKDVYRPCWTGLDREQTQLAVEYLMDLGWLRSTEEETGGRPKVEYWINPKVLASFKTPTAETAGTAISHQRGAFDSFDSSALGGISISKDESEAVEREVIL